MIREEHIYYTGSLADQSNLPMTQVKDKVHLCFERESKKHGMSTIEARNLAKELSIAFQLASEAAD